MKKKEIRRLLDLLEHQQCICLELVKVVQSGYDQDNTAEDSTPSPPHPAPSIHKPIQHIEPESQLEHYR
jgi:hypothetical protein